MIRKSGNSRRISQKSNTTLNSKTSCLAHSIKIHSPHIIQIGRTNMNPVLKGALTFVPGVKNILNSTGRGSTLSADYCYSLWLKHLTLSRQHNQGAPPTTMAELGPGGSLGVGLAAMLSGIDKYYALDVVEYADSKNNLRVFEELVAMFSQRRPRPEKGWPDFDEFLAPTLFPEEILPDTLLEETLAPDRLQAIRNAISNPGTDYNGIQVNYYVPWNSENVIQENSVDYLLSHSTLEHVEDLELAYNSMQRWLKPGGWMSHQIDFGSHGISNYWDGYRKYSEPVWKVVKGRRHYLINRAPQSAHTAHMKRCGFNLALELRNENGNQPQLPSSKLSSRWSTLSKNDLQTQGTFIVCQLK